MTALSLSFKTQTFKFCANCVKNVSPIPVQKTVRFMVE